MSDNASPEPTKFSHKVKKMVVQGVTGTVSLTAAAVLPVLAQRFLAPPTVTPESTMPVQVQSVTPQPQTASPSPAVAEQATAESERRGNREKRRGRDKDDDDEGDD